MHAYYICPTAKSLQSCPTLRDLIDSSPPGSPVPGILQARTLEGVAISFSNAWKWKGKVKSLSRAQLLATPWTAAYQAPPSMGFSMQELLYKEKQWNPKAPVVMYGCESSTIKKAEHWRINAFDLWCWRRLLRVSWTARRSDQSILKKSVLNIHWKTDTEAETPILWPPDAKNWLIEKDPDSGKDWR